MGEESLISSEMSGRVYCSICKIWKFAGDSCPGYGTTLIRAMPAPYQADSKVTELTGFPVRDGKQP